MSELTVLISLAESHAPFQEKLAFHPLRQHQVHFVEDPPGPRWHRIGRKTRPEPQSRLGLRRESPIETLQWMYGHARGPDLSRQVLEEGPGKHPLVVERGENRVGPPGVHPDVVIENHLREQHTHRFAQEGSAAGMEDPSIGEPQERMAAFERFEEERVSFRFEGAHYGAYDFL